MPGLEKKVDSLKLTLPGLAPNDFNSGTSQLLFQYIVEGNIKINIAEDITKVTSVLAGASLFFQYIVEGNIKINIARAFIKMTSAVTEAKPFFQYKYRGCQH